MSGAGPTIVIHPYDSSWPAQFARAEAMIRAALGTRAAAVHHVGSTSVPGLSAKPVVDIVLAVPDSADEPAYVPRLTEAGYAIHLREPHWFEHRLMKGTTPAVNLHVFTQGCSEIDRMLLFRDRLRTHDWDRVLYARTKHKLAKLPWRTVQDYADAKSEVVRTILANAAPAT